MPSGRRVYFASRSILTIPDPFISRAISNVCGQHMSVHFWFVRDRSGVLPLGLFFRLMTLLSAASILATRTVHFVIVTFSAARHARPAYDLVALISFDCLIVSYSSW